MKKLLSYLFGKRATPVDVAVLITFVTMIAGGETFVAIVWLLVGLTFSAVMEIKYGGPSPVLAFAVDSSGNPSLRYTAAFSPADGEAVNKYANASVNQFRAVLYARLQKQVLMEGKGRKFSAKKFAEDLERDFPIVAIK